MMYTSEKHPQWAEFLQKLSNLKVYGPLFGFVMLLGILAVTLYQVQQRQNLRGKAEQQTADVIPAKFFPLNQIRSTTFYDLPYEFNSVQNPSELADDTVVNDLIASLPSIKKNGFNSVWLVVGLIDPRGGLDSPSRTVIDNLKKILPELKKNKLRAILPLTYGLPNKICRIIFSEVTLGRGYQTFSDYIQYHIDLLSGIQDYADIVDIVEFTESSWNCLGYNPDKGNQVSSVLNVEKRSDPTNPNKKIEVPILEYEADIEPIYGKFLNYIENASTYTKYLRNSLGRLPREIRNRDPKLRAKFRFGFHDSFIANKWINSLADSPLAPDNDYDFISWGRYFDPHLVNDSSNNFPITKEQMRAKVKEEIANIKALYPSMPLFRGELGAFGCYPYDDASSTSMYYTPQKQNEMITDMVSDMLDQNIGFNVWGWMPINIRTSSKCSDTALSLTSPVLVNNVITAFRPNEAANTLKRRLLLPIIEAAGITTDTTGVYAGYWRGWIRGKNLNPDLQVARLYDKNGNQWGSDLPINLLSNNVSVAYTLPSKTNIPGCDGNSPCEITVKLYNTAMDAYSNPAKYTVPFPTSNQQSQPVPTISSTMPSISSDKIPPVVRIISPQDGAVVSSTVTIQVEASDESGIGQIRIFADDLTIKICQYGLSSCSVEWNPPVGSHRILVVATDKSSYPPNQTTTALRITRPQ